MNKGKLMLKCHLMDERELVFYDDDTLNFMREDPEYERFVNEERLRFEEPNIIVYDGTDKEVRDFVFEWHME